MIGIGLPDVVLALSETSYRVPGIHWMILLGLLCLQVVLTVLKRNGPDESNGPSLA